MPHTRSTLDTSPRVKYDATIGPSPDPTPRAPSRMPVPPSPQWNTSVASTGSWLTVPAPIAKVALLAISARTEWSARA